ncbi:hypothetical protein HDV01_006638 [Terramyces sp. JEL0728]|nr:hypothetical protein HDV01_006638 [Terramyces sp. JEL0728]
MAGGIIAPFDPTVVDLKEKERLGKSKWLGQISKTGHYTIGSKDKVIEGSNELTKINPTSRFLMALHDRSLEHKKQQEQLQMKRNMTNSQAYDWVIVKQISQEYQFLKYIETLKQKGEAIMEQMHEEDRILIGHLAESITTTEHSKADGEDQTNINKGPKIPITTEKGLALIKEFLDNIKRYMRSSPFRPKLKGQTAMTRHFPDREKDHVFGKPPKFTEEMAMEFNRTFGEIESLGANVQFKISAIEADSRLFEIAPTIAAAIEAIQGNAQTMGKVDKKLETPKNKENIVEGVIELLKREFAADQQTMQKQLMKYLRLRSNERLQKSLGLDSMVETQNLANLTVEQFIDSPKLIPPAPKDPPNLWMYGKVATNFPFEFSKIGIVDPIVPASNIHAFHRDRAAPAVQDAKANLSKMDSQSRFDEQLTAIRLMFAQEFGDVMPQKEVKRE